MFETRLNDEIRIKELLGKDNPVILELGANIGRTAKCLLNCFPHIKLFCFEPDPRNILSFKKNVQDSRCTLVEKAVADVDGKIALNQSCGNWPGQPVTNVHTESSTIKGTIKHTELHKWMGYLPPISVAVTKLDTWRKQNNIDVIDFIWADVEGAEEELIKGAQESLEHTRYFYTEYTDLEMYDGEITLAEIKELLPSNFTMAHCWPRDVLFRNERFS